MNQSVSIKNILILQAVVVVYTLSSVVAKFATGKELFSLSFFLFYGLEIVILGIYAILWQQMIKRFDLLLMRIVQWRLSGRQYGQLYYFMTFLR